MCASAGLTTALSRLRTRAARLVVAVTLLATFVLLEIPPVAALFHLTPLPALDWCLALAAAGVAAVSLLTGSALARPRDFSGVGRVVSSAPGDAP